MRFGLISLFFLLMCSSPWAWAQVDSSSALLLLNRNNNGSAGESSVLESGRFKVRAAPAPSGSKKVLDSTKDETDDGEESPPLPPVRRAQPLKAMEEAKPAPLSPPSQIVVQPPPASQPPPPPIVSPSPQPSEARPLPSPEISKPNSLTDDVRYNLFELSVGTGYQYNESRSTYSYRRYTNDSPMLNVNMRFWLSPLFGVTGDYLSTSGAAISDDPRDSTSTVPIQLQRTQFGFRFRQFFGSSAKASQLLFGFDYRESRMNVSGDNPYRMALKTTGPVLSIQAEIPQSAHYAWSLQFEMAPKQVHTEVDTRLAAKSGTDVKTDAVGVTVGGIFRFSRVHQVYWKVSHTVERNIFSGDAQIADPLTGTTPRGVTVTNSLSALILGYTWGN